MAESTSTWKKLVPLAVVALVSFLAYSSQHLFQRIDPSPLSSTQAWIFNALIGLIFICYYRACVTPPGALPLNFIEFPEQPEDSLGRKRWCRKCQTTKLPRWHHCRSCGECIPKMDHHCVWICNCVSHTTFPHFLRFLFYCVSAMTYLEYFLAIRLKVLWDKRELPSYHGPTPFQLMHLIMLTLTNSITLFALFILLFTSIRSLLLNETTIEGWEKDRHVTLVRRARAMGGYVYGPGGVKVWIKKQEFPYDIGIWANLKQGMGTGNILAWLWPFSASPSVQTALRYKVNGFEDAELSWPPPDPDRIPVYREETPRPSSEYQPNSDCATFSPIDVDAFRQRQADDIRKRTIANPQIQRRTPFYDSGGAAFEVTNDDTREGEEGWRDSNGQRLVDFGVDPEEFYDEDDIPLSQLIKKRKGL